MREINFSPLQLDALREVSNIGAGNAATSLSMLLGQKIDMNVPSVNIVEFSEICDKAGEKEVFGIIVKVFGEIPGNILIVFESNIARNIIENLTGIKDETLTEFVISVLSEMGNILTAGYINSMSEFTGLKMSPSVPAVSYDMLSAILGTAFVEAGQYDDYILDIETRFRSEKKNDCGINFYYVPVPGSLEKILKKIGLN